jgi:hypothetical protein
MGEIKGDSFEERYSIAHLRVKALFREVNEVVVEGLFKRGTPSFNFWTNFAKDNKIELVRLTVERDIDVCERAIRSDKRPTEMRLKFLHAYAPFA